jgi:adsorption protein B
VFPEAIRVLEFIDGLILRLLPAVAVWLLLSGLDDLFIDALALRQWLNRGPARPMKPRRERRIAIFVPAWDESAVLGDMLRHNFATIDYSNYVIFAGAYPNDPRTLDLLREHAPHEPRLRVAVVPHDGPTSKADCLNWIYQHMLIDERRFETHYSGIVVHDAEDAIDPRSLSAINAHLDRYDMVQVPVLPVATGPFEWTHGIYLDDFAESQTKDLPARVASGGFLPSCGVGTALSRRAVEALAQGRANQVFDPAALTEDYEIGHTIHALGFRQIILPADGLAAGDLTRPLATREYFPRRRRAAVRQRTRWITGIALQGWQRNGWGRSAREAYWFWRDRKGLLGNPASLAANLIFAYGLATLACAKFGGTDWGLARASSVLIWPGVAFQIVRLAVRASCSARVYGWKFASMVWPRTVWGNFINCAATVSAVRRFAVSWWTGEPLIWLKTDHAFPTAAALETATANRKTRAAEAG